MGKKEKKKYKIPWWMWLIVVVLAIPTIILSVAFYQVIFLGYDGTEFQTEKNDNGSVNYNHKENETSSISSSETSVLERDKDEILANISKFSITVEGNATESEISMGEYLKEEFMGDYDVTFLADDKIFALMPATQLELETIEMTITDRDTFAWDGFTSLANTYSREIASTLGNQYQIALVSNIYGESILLYRAKNGQGNYDYFKN